MLSLHPACIINSELHISNQEMNIHLIFGVAEKICLQNVIQYDIMGCQIFLEYLSCYLLICNLVHLLQKSLHLVTHLAYSQFFATVSFCWRAPWYTNYNVRYGL